MADQQDLYEMVPGADLFCCKAASIFLAVFVIANPPSPVHLRVCGIASPTLYISV